MENKPVNDIRLLFYYISVYSIIALLTISFDGKSKYEIVEDYFLRCIYAFGIGVFSGLAQMLGMITAREFHKWLKNKNK